MIVRSRREQRHRCDNRAEIVVHLVVDVNVDRVGDVSIQRGMSRREALSPRSPRRCSCRRRTLSMIVCWPRPSPASARRCGRAYRCRAAGGNGTIGGWVSRDTAPERMLRDERGGEHHSTTRPKKGFMASLPLEERSNKWGQINFRSRSNVTLTPLLRGYSTPVCRNRSVRVRPPGNLTRNVTSRRRFASAARARHRRRPRARARARHAPRSPCHVVL